MTRMTRATVLAALAPIFFVGMTSPAQACASCGCTLTADWLSQGLAAQPGTTLSLRYDYIPQTTLRSGTSDLDRSSITLPNDREIERYTYNHSLTLTLLLWPHAHAQSPFSVLLRTEEPNGICWTLSNGW